jgi:small-conductance mechanosensitive channel
MMDRIATWFDQQHDVFIALLTTAGLLIVASVVIFLISRMFERWLMHFETRLHLPYETVLIASRVVCGTLWVITALLVLEVWGVGMSGVWTLMVSAATIIGVGFLATWTLISNFTASFFITIWRPFRLGQSIEILPESLRGRVIDRNLMFTSLREENGCVIEVPNSLFFQKMFRVIGRPEKSPFELIESIGTTSTSSQDRRSKAKLQPTA